MYVQHNIETGSCNNVAAKRNKYYIFWVLVALGIRHEMHMRHCHLRLAQLYNVPPPHIIS